MRQHFTGAGKLQVVSEESESPDIWWPRDRAWCITTDVDMPPTFGGLSAKGIDELFVHPALEILPIELDTRIDVYGDTVNC